MLWGKCSKNVVFYNRFYIEFFRASMALAYLAYLAGNRRQRVGRIFRDRTRPLELYNDREMMARYRLDREGVTYVLQALTPALERRTRRNHALSPETIVFTGLRYFAGAGLFRDNGDIHGIHRQTVSRCVDSVAKGIVRTLMARHICFPRTDEEIQETMAGFYDMKQFPCVIGLIDGTLIPIKGPTDAQDEPLFICRKQYHAMNVQAVVNSKMQFTNLVAKWPGSTHDSHIWNNSQLCQLFETNGISNTIEEFWLLGDSGYQLVPYLLTPYPEPQGHGQKQFNKCHRRTRCLVERVFGVWKARFMCLHKWGGAMIFAPEKCCTVIMATAVLHNICCQRNLPVLNDRGEVVRVQPEIDRDEIYDGPDDRAGIAKRNSLVRRVFANRND